MNVLGKVLVCGAAGYIGSALVRELKQRGCWVRGVDIKQALNEGQYTDEFIVGDLCDPQVITTAVENCDTMFVLAAVKHNGSPDKQSIFDVNILATNSLFQAAVQAGIKRIVFTSSVYAYGRRSLPAMKEDDVPQPDTPYGVSKLAGEKLLESLTSNCNVSTAVLRLFFVYGPKQEACPYKSVILENFARIREGKSPIIFGSGEQSLDYIYIDDVVNALIKAAQSHENICVNIGSGSAIPVNELTNVMLRVADSDLQPEYRNADSTEGSVRECDNSLAKEVLGWTPRVDLNSGLKLVFDSIS